MKRILSLVTAVMLITLTACGGQTQNTAASTPPPDTPPVTQPDNPVEPAELPRQESETPRAEHILIAYFSLWDNAPWGEYTDADTSASVVVDAQGAVGTNAYVARMIQTEAGGDLHAIIAAEPYPADFNQVRDINHQEDSRTISSAVENMEQYSTVFIGYPVWATTLPQVEGEGQLRDPVLRPWNQRPCFQCEGHPRSSPRCYGVGRGGVQRPGMDTPLSTAQATVETWLEGLEYGGHA